MPLHSSGCTRPIWSLVLSSDPPCIRGLQANQTTVLWTKTQEFLHMQSCLPICYVKICYICTASQTCLRKTKICPLSGGQINGKQPEAQMSDLLCGTVHVDATLFYLLPTVQNWPNLFCEATCSPFSSVVTLVSKPCWVSTVAKRGFGTPGRGVVRGMPG